MTAPFENDVIVAIATPPGRGAMGIVRLSGSGAVDVAKKIFSPVPQKQKFPVSHHMYYGNIVHNGAKIDEVMLCCMLTPKSFTREDVVEIYTHGGFMTVRGVLDAALFNGARLALPGEFTRRAFLNGRINLTQAEAVMDLINAQSEAARTVGLRHLGGGFSDRIKTNRDTILRWLANIALSIDYPEHEEEALNRETIVTEGRILLADMLKLQQTAEIGRILREGVKTAIAGSPNVGKSTLLNAILGEDRAITHKQPGTTRDVLTEQVLIGSISLVLMDTAGLRETKNPVEQIGIKRTFETIKEAELILYVVDGTKKMNAFYDFDKNQKVIFIINKNDLPLNEEWEKVVSEWPVISLSAKTGKGLDQLYTEIKKTILSGWENIGAETDIITRERHKTLLAEAVKHLSDGITAFEQGFTEDIAAIHLRAAYLSLGHILGLEYADDMVDRIFAEFCVGK
jgi:tRNA modification GTPase